MGNPVPTGNYSCIFELASLPLFGESALSIQCRCLSFVAWLVILSGKARWGRDGGCGGREAPPARAEGPPLPPASSSYPSSSNRAARLSARRSSRSWISTGDLVGGSRGGVFVEIAGEGDLVTYCSCCGLSRHRGKGEDLAGEVVLYIFLEGDIPRYRGGRHRPCACRACGRAFWGRPHRLPRPGGGGVPIRARRIGGGVRWLSWYSRSRPRQRSCCAGLRAKSV